jgi:hypothetical protein
MSMGMGIKPCALPRRDSILLHVMVRTTLSCGSILALGLVAAGCSSTFWNQGGEDSGDAGGGLAVDEVVVTDAIDLATFAPTGGRGPVFPVTTRELHACVRVRPGSPRATLRVVWTRVGDEAPLASSNLRVGRATWAAASYEPVALLEPGGYLVRVLADDAVLTEQAFEVETSAAAEAPSRPGVMSISRLAFVRELGPDRRPTGPQVTTLPPGSQRVHCVFSVSDAPAGTDVVVRWVRGGNVILTNHLGQLEGDREYTPALEDAAGLAPGLYRVEVTAGETIARAGSFTVEERGPEGGFGMTVSNMTLTSAVAATTGLPAATPLTTIRGDESVLYLSLTFSLMPPGSLLIVRWYEDASPAQPFATSTFRVSDRGSLAASLRPGDPLRAGPYHVDAVVSGRTLATLRFEVEPARPEAPAETPAETPAP